jgi:hypothetical protein
MTYRGESDPIFLRIEVVKAAIAWQDELFNKLCRKVHFLDQRDCEITIPPAWVSTIRISDQIVNEAIEELLTTAPTSLQGVAAILDYVGSADLDMDETRLFEFADSHARDAAMKFPKLLAETIRQLIAESRNLTEESESPATNSSDAPLSGLTDSSVIFLRREGGMKFRVGRFTCEVLLGNDGKLVLRWLPEPPKYLNRAERVQYQAGIAEFLEELERKLGIDQRDRSNLPRLNGGG